jgi:glutamate N-acetyltransferase/amino-acid N-acetyltransferase
LNKNRMEDIIDGDVTAPQGFLAAGVMAGIKYKEKRDVALIYSEKTAAAAGMFTTNLVKAAPLLVTMPRVKKGQARAIIANSGNANACVGERGIIDAFTACQKAAQLLKIPEEHTLVASTGEIGRALPLEKLLNGIETAVCTLSKNGGRAAAEAIMTTDTKPKEAAVRFSLGGREAVAGAIAKGSGMIHPNMATMLCFVTTDAAVSADCLQDALLYAVERSFNMIAIDGDTSTNDMILVLANGMAGNPLITEKNSDYFTLRDKLTRLCQRLARAIARDGEGATKLLEVRVINAAQERDARLAAKAIASSNLVKTAVFGRDANWGRIFCAAGYSGAQFNPQKVDIFLNGIQVAKDGSALNFDEKEAAQSLAADNIEILLDFKIGPFSATAWGCDLSYEYVRINAQYRT